MDNTPFLIKKLHNRLILDIADLDRIAPDTGKVFGTVSKYFYDIPPNQPALYLQSGQLQIPNRDNLGFDDLRVSFTAFIYQVMESSTTQADMDTKVDLLNDCIIYLYRYIGEVPNNLGDVDGVTVFNSEFLDASSRDVTTPSGQGLEIAVSFALDVSVDVKLINE